MKRRLSLVVLVVAAFCLLLPVHPASAQVSRTDARCRALIMKRATKYAATASKVIDRCLKAQLKGKRDSANDCNDLAVADDRDKAAKARLKLVTTVGAGGKCSAVANAAALAKFASCPSPGNAADDGGATPGIDGFPS